jgi:hypothetical protein
VGQDAASGGAGGAGAVSAISGSSVTYATGGGGNSSAGSANTGNGGDRGAGGALNPGYAGGSGVVIIRYLDAYTAAASTTGSPTITVAGGYRVYQWTGSGSITF